MIVYHSVLHDILRFAADIFMCDADAGYIYISLSLYIYI